jgi:LAS superfamily LD-carboxypeptidase LdcB
MDNSYLGKVYSGIVVDIKDPRRLGRVRVKVATIFEEIEVTYIPWATPYKGLSGKNFHVPQLGKLVNIMFENGYLYSPVYIYTEHFNINLQKKLENLSEDDYTKFIAILFDHKTQIYIDNNGFRLDYLYNQIHINEENISFRLKDNTQILNLGSSDSNQDAVLGTNFFKWFDKFVNKLIIPTTLTGNLGAPILRPELDALMTEYQTIKNTFLSKHVKLPDNNKIEKVKRDIETVAAENDKDIQSNDQDPFVSGQKSTPNSEILTEDVKSNIKEKTENEQSELNDAKPSKSAKVDEIDYHENNTDAPNDVVYMIDDNGELYSSSYEDLQNEDKYDYVGAEDIDINNSYENDESSYTSYNDEVVITDDNYGTYITSNIINNDDNINTTPVKVPNSEPKRDVYGNVQKDNNGNAVYEKVDVYLKGKIIGKEEYVTFQNQKVIRKYFEPFKRMYDAAKKDGINIILVDAFRFWDEQYGLRVQNKKKDFTEQELKTNSSTNYKPYTGRPGQSLHHYGTAFDMQTNNGKNKTYKWLVKNAIKYGFIRTVESETWHWEYQPWLYSNIKANNQFAIVNQNHESWMNLV